MQSTRIEPAQHFGPVTEAVLVNYFGRYMVCKVVGVINELEDGKSLTWYVVQYDAREQPLMVALSTLTMVPAV